MSVAKLFEKLGTIIGNRSTLVLAVALLLLLPSLAGASLITMETGLDTLVSTDSEVYQDYEAYHQTFLPTETIVVLLTADDILDFHVLTAMSRLEDTLGEERNITRVTSLASVIKGAVKEYYGEALIPPNKVQVRQITGQLPQDLRQSLMPDEQHAIVAVEISATSSDKDMERVLHQVECAVDWADFPPNVGVTVTGDPVFATQLRDEMSSSLGVTLLVACLLMLLILWFIFRHVRWRLLPFAAVIVGVVWTFGTMGFLGIPMTMVSMAAFPLLIGVGIDRAIQLHNRLDEEIKSNKSVKTAIVESVKKVGPAVGLAVIAAILGFMALFTSPVPMIRDFGKLSIIGLALCYLAAIFFLVPLLYKLYQRVEKKGGVDNRRSKDKRQSQGAIARGLGGISVRAARYPLIVLLIAGSLCAIGYFYDQKVEVALDEKDLAPPSMPAAIEMKSWEHLVGGITLPLNIIVKADDVTSPEVLNWMDEFGQYEVELRDEVKGVSSLASLVKQANQGRIPDTSAEISLILERIPEQQKGRYIQGKSAAALNFDILFTDPLEIGTARDYIERDLSWKQPPVGVDITIAGRYLVVASVLSAMTTGRLGMTSLSLVLIFLGLLVIYRDWIKALIPVIPVALVTGFTGGAMYLMGLQYNPLTATLGALALGLGAEYTILVMARYFEERDKGETPFEAIETATQRVGVAIASSGITSIAGFGALILSGFPILRGFGIITVVIFVLVLLVTFTVLPALLVPLDRWRSARRKGTG